MNNKNFRIILILSILAIISIFLYLFYDINPEIIKFALSLRIPKLLAMILAAICISISTYVFQTIVSNYLITPSLLGMNSLYLLIQTGIVFVLGSSSYLFTNQYISFVFVLIIMSIISIFLYSYLFKKTDYNIVYILLIGTVLSTLFNSMQKSMIRVMDPNEYDSILNSLVASFSNIKSDLVFIGYILVIVLLICFRKDFKNLDVMSLGKNISINLGIDYDKESQTLLLIVSILVAISTALVGPITFLGLIVVSIVRNIINSFRYNILMTGSAILGIVIL
ncbi:MAG: iron chelate uptake ABC transporter family permease subunit, partial [Helcococcus sp.]|nr:iron chelate uptake ABC transporter family permease subunit [Helcococcus sp.]